MVSMTLSGKAMETEFCVIEVFSCHFKSSNNYNYAKEAVNLLLQYNYTLTERRKKQLLWIRCINTRGYAGCNIPCDLFMEHLNHGLNLYLEIWGQTSLQRLFRRLQRQLHQYSTYATFLNSKQQLPCILHSTQLLVLARI